MEKAWSLLFGRPNFEGREKAAGHQDEQERHQDDKSSCQGDLELLPAGPHTLLDD